MYKSAIIWGVILGLILVTMTQVLTWMGLGTSSWYFVLSYLLVVGVAWMFIQEIQKNQGTVPSFWTTLLPFAIVVIISRYIFQLYMYIYIHHIDPTWVDTIAETWTGMMQDQNMDAPAIETAVAGFRKAYTTLPMFTTEIFKIGISQWILGIIVIGGYCFMKRDKNREAGPLR